MSYNIRLLILFLLISIPYGVGEYIYQNNLGTRTGTCVRVWESESCYKGRNCHYTNHGLVLYNDNTVESYEGNYVVGNSYSHTDTYGFIWTTYFGGNMLSDLTQIHRLVVNFSLIIILLICSLVGFFATTDWMLFPNRCKTPFSYLVLWCGVDDLMDSDYKKNQFMDSLPKYFYKKEK